MTNPATRPDLIDRAALREAVERAPRVGYQAVYGKPSSGWAIPEQSVLALIDAAPAAEPVPPHLPLTGYGAVVHPDDGYAYDGCNGPACRNRRAEPVPLTLDALTLIPFVERPMTAAYFEDLKAGRLSSEQVARAIAGDLAALRAASSEGPDRPARDPESPAP